MKLVFPSVGRNHYQNINRRNQSGGAGTAGGPVRPEKRECRDIVTISPEGKVKNFLETLIKQKVNIVEQRKTLIGKTLEKGDTLDSIKAQLEAYDEQLKNIDRQIAELTAMELEKQTEKMKPRANGPQKTDEEAQSERLANLSGLSGDLEHVRTVGSSKKRIDGEARVLTTEIKLDKAHAARSKDLTAKVDPKEARLVQLEQRSLRLVSKTADKLADILEEAENNRDSQDAVPDEKIGADDRQGGAALPVG